jgi:hypothetical protein
VLALLIAGCAQAAPAQPSPTTTATALVVNETTKTELAAVLQRRQTALSSRDLPGFQATVDLTRPAFRRCEQETFDSAARQGASSEPVNVIKVEPYGNGYVRA